MTDYPPEMGAEPGWTEIDQHRPPLNRRFVSADADPKRFRVRYWKDADGNLAAKVRFGPNCEGPPGHAHGGSLASVLDEAMGGNSWLHGHAALAGTLTIKYRAPFPLETVATVTSKIERVEGRKVFTSGAIRSADGTLHAEGEGIFVVMREDVQQMLAAEARKDGRAFGDAY